MLTIQTSENLFQIKASATGSRQKLIAKNSLWARGSQEEGDVPGYNKRDRRQFMGLTKKMPGIWPMPGM